ncbi:MAG: tRNA (guanosine(37)-N1)-methyltransferase TrmD [Chloroflexi bacterium]|nr:tRNA (guanosine(37)-N1)-methyltransferase TrmD [Chloroflexota bacterium]MQG01004.1 tRNA (guanosine(37)-N1)-methyltransferase TrmD [SAR202 cluster bacterium]
MKFHIFTLFPNMFSSPLDEGILARAIKDNVIQIFVHNIRDYTNNPHRTVDDYPFGGGPGMLMKPEPIFEAVENVAIEHSLDNRTPKILMTPQGRTFNHEIAQELSGNKELVLICGRYEGVDDRVRQYLATDEISVGDYVLSGGELPAMTIIDAVSRLIPGTVGSKESIENDSFYNGNLQFPQFTRPVTYRGMEVPKVLLSGNHKDIQIWREEQSCLRTRKQRPDLID